MLNAFRHALFAWALLLLAPGATESYTLSDDGRTFTFKIRPGQIFASGNPLTAADAVFSLRRVIKLDKTPAFLIGQLG